MRHVAAKKLCRGDKILINRSLNFEAFTPSDLSLQLITAMSAYASCRLTVFAFCCSNVSQRFVVWCVLVFMISGDWSQ